MTFANHKNLYRLQESNSRVELTARQVTIDNNNIQPSVSSYTSRYKSSESYPLKNTKEQLQYLGYCSKLLFRYTSFKKVENLRHFAQSVLTRRRIFRLAEREMERRQVRCTTGKDSDIIQHQSFILHQIFRRFMVL